MSRPPFSHGYTTAFSSPLSPQDYEDILKKEESSRPRAPTEADSEDDPDPEYWTEEELIEILKTQYPQTSSSTRKKIMRYAENNRDTQEVETFEQLQAWMPALLTLFGVKSASGSRSTGGDTYVPLNPSRTLQLSPLRAAATQTSLTFHDHRAGSSSQVQPQTNIYPHGMDPPPNPTQGTLSSTGLVDQTPVEAGNKVQEAGSSNKRARRR